ncbi:MAG: AMP-binding protein [Salinivirgaceae bacterium]|nr:AMP-binding protein [Salinivirgaceae bacterium]
MRTFVNYIESAIVSNWDINALSNYKGATMTYGQVGETIKKIHSAFEQLGIKKGDKIVIIGRNTSSWACSFLSVVTFGTVSVPILQDFSIKDIENTVNHSDSVLMFVSDYIYKDLDISKFPNIRGFISLDDWRVLSAIDENVKTVFADFESKTLGLTANTFELKDIAHDALATISYTSGTSGHSKGVMLTHGNYATNVEFGTEMFHFNPGDNIVSMLPMAHAYGLAFEFLTEFVEGCHVTFLVKTPTPQLILQSFAELHPRLIVVVPLILEKVYKSKVKPAISSGLPKILLAIPLLRQIVYKKVRRQLESAFGDNFFEVIVGGAALNKEVESFLNKIKFRYTVGYGMTECAPIICYSPWNRVKKFSCGYPIRRCTVRIDSPDPQNVEGEILVKGSQVMLGYYKNIDATNATFDSEGWLRTGDLGVMDANGYVTIKGRSKNMILGASGQNIYPEEIESQINNLPYVAESLVVERQGKLHALIVPDIEKAERDGLDREKVQVAIEQSQKELNKQMPNYMSIAKIELQNEEFVKTPKKSIKRYLYN